MSLATNLSLVTISLQYEGKLLSLQINPESMKKNIPSGIKTTEVLGIGEIAVPVTPGLAEIQISSFFWQQRSVSPVKLYVNWLLEWQKSKKPAKLITTLLPYTMQVVCESFDYESRAGEESDVYYNLSLKEYRPYGARSLSTVQPPESIIDKIEKTLGEKLPTLVNIPLPVRINNNEPVFTSPFTAGDGDTLAGITEKITGSTEKWKELYNENKEKVSEGITSTLKNVKLKLPSSWTKGLDIISEKV